MNIGAQTSMKKRKGGHQYEKLKNCGTCIRINKESDKNPFRRNRKNLPFWQENFGKTGGKICQIKLKSELLVH